MKSLFQEFNYSETFSRVNEKMGAFLDREMVFTVPRMDRIRVRFADNLVDYIEEMVRTRGQESKAALDDLEYATDEFSVLEEAGVIREGWYDRYFKMGSEILFDELRRCGIGKVEGSFVDE